MTPARMLLAFLLTCLALAFPRPALADLKVVVTSKPAHALVASVMAGIAAPDLLVSGAASPHTYSMKPSDALKVNRADVFIRVSEALEPFTARVIASLPQRVRIVTLADAPGLTLLKRREGGAFEEHDHGEQDHPGHAHAHENQKPAVAYDPHIWLDPGNAVVMVRYIADTLVGLAPDKAALIRSNADAEIARISNLAADLERELKPVAGKPFIVYHDAFQYLEKRFGLAAVGSVTVTPDAPPGGKRLRELRQKITGADVQCVFAEPQLDRRATSAVTEGTRIRIGTLDPEGTLLSAGPDLYHVLMRNLADGLKACLAASS